MDRKTVDLAVVATVLGVFGLTNADPDAVAGKRVDADVVRVVLTEFGLTSE